MEAKESAKDDGDEAEPEPKKDDDSAAPEEFTELDNEEREALLQNGWPNWNKKDFFNFVKMCVKYGRDASGSFENF